MPHPKVKIADNSGNEVAVTSNALDVNIAGGASIDIGDVEILGHSTIASYRNRTISNSGAVNLNGGSGAGGVGSSGDSIPCKHLDLMADIDNTGIIYVGGSGVTVENGIALYAGDVYSLDIDDVNNVFVLASVDAEDIVIIVYN
jgi:hypothetical protein